MSSLLCFHDLQLKLEFGIEKRLKTVKPHLLFGLGVCTENKSSSLGLKEKEMLEVCYVFGMIFKLDLLVSIRVFSQTREDFVVLKSQECLFGGLSVAKGHAVDIEDAKAHFETGFEEK